MYSRVKRERRPVKLYGMEADTQEQKQDAQSKDDDKSSDATGILNYLLNFCKKLKVKAWLKITVYRLNLAPLNFSVFTKLAYLAS
jgi:hypothetical protein